MSEPWTPGPIPTPVPLAVSGSRFVVAFLNAQYALRGKTVRASTRVRDPRPATFTKVRQMSATRSFVVRYAPTIVFECWATDPVAAEDLGILTETLINGLPELSPDCTRVVEVGGLYDQEDPASGTPRWIFSKQIYLRSTVLV